ncbi:hypothetical protein CCR85_02520 [Rhodothalassium salexigens]|nr:hypothetical protein [Rhodothalassium salexigens]MBK5921023.1 hypothetical protein [Rhodothalassium salexigens]
MVPSMSTIAVMQPYFVPYAGYFRLLAAADIFVLFDCVQFPRRGWVHRNRFRRADGTLDWLTLPLAKAPHDARIADLAFQPDAEAEMRARMGRFPALADALDRRDPLADDAAACAGQPADYLAAQIETVANRLGFGPAMVRSSTLDTPPDLRGAERIIHIVRQLGGRRYVNSPGGRALYTPNRFADAGLDLAFLVPYQNDMSSILDRLLREPPADLRADILAATQLVD